MKDRGNLSQSITEKFIELSEERKINMENEAAKASQPGKIAFLGYMEFDNGASYRGAILITDDWGKPLEFRCTAPVKPNPVQKTLYGQTLLPHVLVELVGAPLLQAVQERPEIIVIQESLFFDLRHKTETPMVRLWRQGADVKLSGEEGERSKPVVVASESGKFDPVVMETHWKFGGDMDFSRERLRELFGRWDLVEPFERLSKGLEYVHQQKVLAS
jgi:hypothetical protein